jgi:long-chain acyl-CoA synthetase
VSARLLERLALHARTRPDAIAVREASDATPRRALDWRALHDAAAALAAQLRDAESAPVLVVSVSNRIELLVALLAGLAADGAVLPVSPDLPPAQLRDVATRAGASIAIGDAAALAALEDCVTTRITADVIALQPPGVRTDLATAGHSGALLLLSSGTTDVPKLVRREAAALDAMARACHTAIGVTPDDVVLLAIPLHHSYGIDQALLTAVFAGCRIELHDGFELARVRASLRDDGVTLLPVVPFLFDVLARANL